MSAPAAVSSARERVDTFARGTDTMVTSGTSAAETASMLTALWSGLGLGYVQVGGTSNRVYFTTDLEQANYNTGGGADAVMARSCQHGAQRVRDR